MFNSSKECFVRVWKLFIVFNGDWLEFEVCLGCLRVVG